MCHEEERGFIFYEHLSIIQGFKIASLKLVYLLGAKMKGTTHTHTFACYGILKCSTGEHQLTKIHGRENFYYD